MRIDGIRDHSLHHRVLNEYFQRRSSLFEMFEGELLLGLRRHRRRRRRGWRGGGEARLELTQVLSSSGK